ncbi:hypothetical protein WQ54_25710 [Bacillus sp. SA1-12]|uniref:hypothetical protein n=1 Tax=Bacillus sp. SA1-12 TaxID=1455638 RepID=UPI0006273C33|nr:hypothetical protein [Bacillus sp. SA1-12]KKI89743.1 hypothetical protein WQ54_25710 [Bacillus sp. SA1-12]
MKIEIMKAEGEWFVWVLVLISVLVVLFMPKKNLTWVGVYITFGMAGYMTWVADAIVGGTFDLFDLAGKKTIELGDAFLISFVPASLSAIFANFYNPRKRWVYAVFFTLLSFVLELGLVQTGYMENINWKTIYGIPVYFFFYGFFFPWFLRVLTKKKLKVDT